MLTDMSLFIQSRAGQRGPPLLSVAAPAGPKARRDRLREPGWRGSHLSNLNSSFWINPWCLECGGQQLLNQVIVVEALSHVGSPWFAGRTVRGTVLRHTLAFPCHFYQHPAMLISEVGPPAMSTDPESLRPDPLVERQTEHRRKDSDGEQFLDR